MAAKHIVKAGGLTGTPGSVVIDVYGEDDPSTKLATVPNGDVQRVGTSNVYQCDLRASSVAAALLLPKDGEHLSQSYSLVWKSDAPGNEIFGSTVVGGTQDRLAIDRMFRQESLVYPSTPVPERGITLREVHGKRPSYVKVELFADPSDLSTPAATYFEVYHYNADGSVQKRAPSPTAPSP